jgi:ATP adenylyltransferase
MEHLWAPWRMGYILSDKPDKSECILCAKIGDDPERDRDNYVLYRGRAACIILNLYPYNNGHLMVLPYEHTANLDELPEDVQAELMHLVSLSVRLLRRVMKPDGFNIGANMGRIAGAGVDRHIHLHIVPRWTGDTNFMPVIANTRVIPELLDQTYDRLRVALTAEGSGDLVG